MLSLAIRQLAVCAPHLQEGRMAVSMSRPARTTLWLALLAASAGGIAAGAAQDPVPAQPPQVPVFRTGIDSISVDVTVTDRQGRAIADLAKDDFEIREGGRVQAIDTFKFIQIDDGREDPSAQRDILSYDEQRVQLAREDNRIFVLFLDDYHVRRANSMRVREQLAAFIAQLSPRDLVAVTTPVAMISSLTFSRNHDATARMAMDFEGRKYDYTPRNAIEARYQHMTPEAQEQVRNDLVIASLRNLCEQLGGMRDGRKTVLYVSEGMSGSIPGGVSTRGTWMPSRPAGTDLPNQGTRDFFETAALTSNLQRVFQAAARNNVSIYTFDPRGLANYEYGIEEDVSSADDRRIINESTDVLRVLAEETDGRAIVSSNQPLRQLQQMVRDSSAYYLLGYTSSIAPRDGRFHKIEVRVKRRDVDVRARKGYWAITEEDVARATAPPRPSLPAEVSEALGQLASTDRGRNGLIHVWTGAARGPAEKALVTVAWEANATPGAAPDPVETVSRVQIVAESIAGEELFRGAAPRDERARSAGGQVTFDAPPGSVHVRLTVENARGGRLDTREADIDVPDFSGTGPYVTTPFVYRGRTARDLQLVRAATAPTPSVGRIFSRLERLLIRFGAYGPGGVAPKVTLRLLNNAGDSMASMPPPRSTPAGFETELALSSFPPGDYLVEIIAEVDGETATQFVALRVTG
jgi:VWFA-related protein